MNYLVKILSSDKGDKYKYAKWCLVDNICGGNATFCKSEYFGEGESGCDYKTKKTTKGGITCPECLERIKKIKSIKL